MVELKKLKILVVDDHPLFRSGLAMIFEEAGFINKIVEAGSIAEATKMSGQLDLILVDVQMPGLDGISGIPVLKEHFENVPIIVLSATAEASQVIEAKVRGAIGFLKKTSTTNEFISVIDGALKGEPQFSNTGTSMLESPSSRPKLTPRQLEVLTLLAEGKPNKLIARHLNLSENTIRTHVSAIFDHLNVMSRTEAVLIAQRLGLISPV